MAGDRGWFWRKLVAEGATGRYAVRRRCKICDRVIFVGADYHVAALVVATDTEELDPYGEALARLNGLGTFAVRTVNKRMELTRRDHWQIKGEPAGSQRKPIGGYYVVAEHECEQW